MSADSKDIFNRSAYDAAERQAKSREARKAGKTFGAQRFWTPCGIEKHVIFLDDNPPELVEHQVTIDGNWRNWYVCCRKPDHNGFWTVGDCPFCDMKVPKYLMGPYSVVDETGYTTKSGEERKNLKCVLVAKERSLNKFKRLSQRHGGLKGSRFVVARTDDKSVVIGDDWVFVEKVDEKVFNALDKDPVVYREYFKTVTVEEANNILKSGTITIPDRNQQFNQNTPKSGPTNSNPAPKSEESNVEY